MAVRGSRRTRVEGGRPMLGTGELKRNAEVSVAEFRAATARVDGFLTELATYLPGVDLKHVDW